MKQKIWPDNASMLEVDDWLAELREDGRAEPPPAGRAEPPPAGRAEPPPADRAEPVGGGTRLAVLTEPEPVTPTGATVRALIGDDLRMPMMWCEMGSCISWHADPAALGEGDARARAIGAGWRIDAFGRLACPRCQQTDPDFRASRPVVRWDRYTAIARAAGVAALRGHRTALKQRF